MANVSSHRSTAPGVRVGKRRALFQGHRGFENDEMLTVPTNTIAPSLENSSIDDNGSKDFARPPSLRCLDLDSSGITDRALGSIAALPALEELRLELRAGAAVGHGLLALRLFDEASVPDLLEPRTV